MTGLRHSAAGSVARELGMTVRRALSDWQSTLRLAVIIAVLALAGMTWTVGNPWSSVGHLGPASKCETSWATELQ